MKPIALGLFLVYVRELNEAMTQPKLAARPEPLPKVSNPPFSSLVYTDTPESPIPQVIFISVSLPWFESDL